MSEFTDIAKQKKDQAIAAVVEKENQIIRDAMSKHFGNDEFERNAMYCSTYTDPKTGVRKIFHDDVLLCEFHPIYSSSQDVYHHSVSFKYRTIE